MTRDLRPGEVVDTASGVPLIQPRRGYRVDEATPHLVRFAAPRPGERVVDLGCGGGALLALAAAAEPRLSAAVGVERQAAHCDRARRNGVRAIQGDVRRLPLQAGVFDLALCNPPHFPAGYGRRSSNPLSAAATHELHGTLADFTAAAARALTGRGRLCLLYPRARTDVLLEALASAGLAPVRMAFLARHVLCEAVRSDHAGPLRVEPSAFSSVMRRSR